MFRQILSRIQHDDNPRLHHTPFLILWMASYGLGWFLLRTYEMQYYAPWVSDFFSWLNKYDYTDTNRWREEIFLGLLFGISLAFVQTFLLKRRYGYVPKYWRVATIIGAILGGFGYIKTGWVSGTQYSYPISRLLMDFLLWFSLINIAQTVVLIRINRKAWRIAGVGILSGLIACAVTLSNIFIIHGEDFALMLGIIIHAVGTGIVMLQVMAEPRSGSVPKRDSGKSKNTHRKGFHPLTFIGLWFIPYAISSMFWQQIMWKLYNIGHHQFSILRPLNSWLSTFGLEQMPNIIFITCSGFILAVGQQWLMKQQFKPIRHWILLSTIGWVIAGLALSYYVSTFRLDRNQTPLWVSLYFLAPIVFQAIAMARTMRFGWLWASPIIVIIPTIASYPYFSRCYGQRLEILQIGLLLTSITGLLFLVLCSLQQEQPSLEVEE